MALALAGPRRHAARGGLWGEVVRGLNDRVTKLGKQAHQQQAKPVDQTPLQRDFSPLSQAPAGRIAAPVGTALAVTPPLVAKSPLSLPLCAHRHHDAGRASCETVRSSTKHATRPALADSLRAGRVGNYPRVREIVERDVDGPPPAVDARALQFQADIGLLLSTKGAPALS